MNQAFAPAATRSLLAIVFVAAIILLITLLLVQFRFGAPKSSNGGAVLATSISDTDTITVTDQSINECSGIVVSRKNPGGFWMHNDSGDSPRLFLVDSLGQTRLRLHLTGAEAIDWEDLAIGQWDGHPTLIVGDIGGNARQRDDVVLYLAREPEIDLQQKKEAFDQQQVPDIILRVRIPGGVTNYEGIGFDSVLSSVLLMEKSVLGGRIYSIAIPPRDASSNSIEVSVDAKPIARCAIPTATACDISNDNSKLVAINYNAGFLFQRKLTDGQLEPWSDALNREPEFFDLPQLRQAEAICFAEDGQSVYVSSEFSPSPIIKLTLPATLSSKE